MLLEVKEKTKSQRVILIWVFFFNLNLGKTCGSWEKEEASSILLWKQTRIQDENEI